MNLYLHQHVLFVICCQFYHQYFYQHTLIGANGAMISQQSMISVIKPIHTDTYHHILKIIQKYELDYIIDDDWNYAAQLDAENAIFRAFRST